MILAEFTLGDAILTMVWIFFLVIFFWLLITVFADIFRSHDLSGWAKAAWVVLVIFFPLLGILVYLIVRGEKMQQHRIEDTRAADAAFRQYVQSAVGVAPGGGVAEQLERLHALHEKGVLSDDEYARLKAKLVES